MIEDQTTRARNLGRDIRLMKWAMIFLLAVTAAAALAQEWTAMIYPGVSSGICAAFLVVLRRPS